jgi:hypothetical protein
VPQKARKALAGLQSPVPTFGCTIARDDVRHAQPVPERERLIGDCFVDDPVPATR